MTHKVTLIPGDGIGPEVIQATVRILEATGVKFEWETFAAGAEAFAKYKEYIPKELTESIERTRVGLKGPVTTPIGGGFSSINVELRKRFEHEVGVPGGEQEMLSIARACIFWAACLTANLLLCCSSRRFTSI